jgi:hypothetical protein
MSLNAQKAKVAQMREERKKKGEKVDWGNQAAVQSFNSFQDSLKKEEAKLASMEHEASTKKEWDFDGGWDD